MKRLDPKDKFLLTEQDAADIRWLIELALPHVTLNPKTKRRLVRIAFIAARKEKRAP